MPLIVRSLWITVILAFISSAQIKNDFIIADTSMTPSFGIEPNGNLNVVWRYFSKNDQGVYYSYLDASGKTINEKRKISTTSASAFPSLAIKDSLVLCLWEDKRSLQASLNYSLIIGRILKSGVNYSDEIEFDDYTNIQTDGVRSFPVGVWHSDSILYSVWSGDGSRSPIYGLTDIYAQKMLIKPAIQRASLYNYVVNNIYDKLKESSPSVVKITNASGYLVVWIQRDSLRSWSIAGVSCDDSLKPNSSKIVYKHFSSLPTDFIAKPVVLNRKNGNYLLIWEKDTANDVANIYVQEFTVEGAFIGSAKIVNDIAAVSATTVTADIDSTGNIIIAWEDGTNIMAQRYSPTMDKLGTNFRINTSVPQGTDMFPVVKIFNGKIYSVWERYSSGKPSVWMNILDYNYPTMVDPMNNEFPTTYELLHNYPNPFNPTTTIGFSIPKAGETSLRVYDVVGREVAVLLNEYQPAGYRTIIFDASRLSSGVYLYTLTSGSFRQTKRMMVIK